MDEIRFRHSEDEAIKFGKRLGHSPFLTSGECSRCKRWRPGHANVSNMEFICIPCAVVQKYEELVKEGDGEIQITPS